MAGRRLLAELVDLGLATLMAVAVSKLVAQAIRGAPTSWLATDSNLLLLFLWSIACVSSTLLFAYRWHRGEPTLGYRIFGLKVRDRATHGVLSQGAAFARWIVLYAPITLWVYPLVAQTVFDHTPFLDLIVLPAWLYQMMLVPIIWDVLLAISILRSPTGRGWQDRVSGAVVLSSVAVAEPVASV